MMAVPGAERIDEHTVAVRHPDLTTLRDNMGTLRAPEMEVYQRDIGQNATTGLFTRLGGEPYQSTATIPLPKR